MPAVRVAGPRVSVAELQRMADDGRQYELYDGALSLVPAPIPRHQVVVDNLSAVLRGYAAAHGGLSFTSPLDIVLGDYDVVQPDVVFFVASRRHLVDLDSAIRYRPDLVIEVLSPSTRDNDRGRKLRVYARAGVPEYWIADPATAYLEVHSLRDGGYQLLQVARGDDVVRSVTLPDLSCHASVAFQMP